MIKFGYIINDKNELVEFFRTDSKRAMEFELFMEINLLDYSEKQIFQFKDIEKTNNNLKKRINYFLSIRNNKNPDYEIDWKGRFEKENMFNKISVLGNEMELFNGNEDNIISFMANIENQIKNKNLKWFLTRNDKEQRKLMNNKL